MVLLDLSPAPVEIAGVRAGDRNLIRVIVRDHGAVVNLTGLTASSQVRKKSTDTAAALTAEVVVTDAANGIATVRWDGDDVRTLLAGTKAWKGVWDLQFQAAGEDPVTYAEGPWSAEMDVTRP